MDTGTSGSGAADAIRRSHALGLPTGSIRAILAILIFATVWGLLILKPSREVPDFLRDLLFIIMGHYFASRRLRAASSVPDEPSPLYLPRGSIRLLLAGGCVAVGVLLHRRGQLTTIDAHPGSLTLLLIGGFFLGVAFSTASDWWIDRGHRPPRIVEDLRALISLAAAILLVVLVWNRLFHFFPPEAVDRPFARYFRLGRYGPEHLLAPVVGFYFGSRS